jgi:hypothetical protein
MGLHGLLQGQLYLSPFFTHRIGACVGPRTGLEDMEKRKLLPLPGLELRPLSRPARNQSLYRLSYPGSSRLGLCA